ncbi:unnamed protein product [Phytophthora fragariaefolia]|uniref:Unnamed protein product n=1 Tax=Phytophthora fragariaefolia TaxID=1490495 RepID=A0A9W7D6N7_9STRA|nr:unnamed protein product [Phytophthora fragariaefolia]
MRTNVFFSVVVAVRHINQRENIHKHTASPQQPQQPLVIDNTHFDHHNPNVRSPGYRQEILLIPQGNADGTKHILRWGLGMSRGFDGLTFAAASLSNSGPGGLAETPELDRCPTFLTSGGEPQL